MAGACLLALAVGQALLNPGSVALCRAPPAGGEDSALLHLKSPDAAQVTRMQKSPFAHFTKGAWKFFPVENPRLHISERSRQMCFQQPRTQFKEAEDQRENGKQKGNSPLYPQ